MRDLWSNRETLYKLLDLDPAEKREWLIDEVQDEEMVNQLSDEGLDDLIYDDAQAWEELDNEEFLETWLPWIEKQTFEGLVILTGAREEVVPAYYLCDTDWRQYDEVGLVEDGGNLLLELDEQEQCQMYAIPIDKEGLEAFIKECMGMAIDDKEDELYWQYENDSEFLRNELLAKSLEAVVDEIRNGEGYHYVDSYCDFAKASQFCKPIEAPVNDATTVNYDESLEESKNLKEDWDDYCYTALESFIRHLDPDVLADKIHSADNEEDLAAWLCDEVFQDDYYGADPDVSHACYDVAYDILYDGDMDESLEEPVSEAINVDKSNYKDLQDELVELKDYYEYVGPDGFYAIPLKQFAVEFPLFYDLILMSFVTEYLDIDVETEDPDELENSWSMGELVLPEDWPALFKGADDGIHRATSTTKDGAPRKKQQWDAVYPQFLKGFEKA